MSDDIVARIRSEAMPACRRDVDYVPAFQNLMHAYLAEAADEIERLRKQLAITEAACDMWRGVAFEERTGGGITPNE